MLGADLVIEARKPNIDRVHVLARDEVVALISQAFAGPVGSRPVTEHILRNGMDPIVRNSVARKRIANILARIVRIGVRRQVIVDLYQPALVIEGLREISSLLGCGRYSRQELVRTALPYSFVIDKEERPVANDAASRGCTEL